jgi:hypothetical protein
MAIDVLAEVRSMRALAAQARRLAPVLPDDDRLSLLSRAENLERQAAELEQQEAAKASD